MSRGIIARALPVTAALIAGASVFLLFGGITTIESSGSYACPMLCVVLDSPGICPVCGMELEQLVETGDTIIVSDVGTALAGLGSVDITLRDLATVRRFPAQVVLASESVVEATAWVDGRITDLRITGPGEQVDRGQILAVLHSPQVQSARGDYQAAVVSGDSFLIEAASSRLLELGSQPGSETDPSGIAYIRSPVAGTIGAVLKNSGSWISRGTSLAAVIESNGRELRIDIPENMVHGVETGLPVSSSISGKNWNGSIDRMAVQLDPGTLTLPVFSLLPDSLSVVPGSYVMAEVRFTHAAVTVVAVPERAVLSLGERSVVYLDLGDSHYLPRVVEIGELSFDDNSEPYYPVVSGLVAGDRVVLDGAFLLDSQAELTGVTSLMNTGDEL
ncbi:MAG: efflux RND transporter periplasmic adaptor subunit [Candidatus Sabulitectum sp.]|nr:efflux RND transporter periplasmic adaptor subunit [Candidatus Sabulitectum sp.]